MQYIMLSQSPSFYAFLVTGLLLFFLIIIFIVKFRSILKLNFYQLLILFAAITNAFGIHGLLLLSMLDSLKKTST